MKYLLTLLLFYATAAFAQPQMVEHQVGHVYYMSLPDYMQPTSGLNESANLQYQSMDNDAYVIVIDQSKESLAPYGITDLESYYTDFVSNFALNTPDRNVGDSIVFTIGTMRFISSQATARLDTLSFAYLLTCAESRDYFYKIICWTALNKKESLMETFMKITRSLHE